MWDVPVFRPRPSKRPRAHGHDHAPLFAEWKITSQREMRLLKIGSIYSAKRDAEKRLLPSERAYLINSALHGNDPGPAVSALLSAEPIPRCAAAAGVFCLNCAGVKCGLFSDSCCVCGRRRCFGYCTLQGEENEDVFKRESMGVVANSLSSVFPLAVAERLISDPWYDRREDIKPRHVFVAFDPNGGGPSHSAIVAVTRIDGALVVCGLDSLQTYNTSQAKTFIAWFIGQLRQDWWLKDAAITYACENNGLTFGLMEEVMAGVPNSRTVYEKAGGKPGIWTDQIKKNAYACYLRQEMQRGAIKFLRQFITCFGMPAGGSSTAHGQVLSEDDKRTTIRRELFEQTKRARQTSRPYTNDMRPRPYSWSAKCNADGEVVPGMNDDLLLALCIGLYVLRMYEANSSAYTQAQWGLPGESRQTPGVNPLPVSVPPMIASF